jgi:hypothetical protein
MSPINYKVILKGSKREDEKGLSLTFRSLDSKKPISIPPQIILELKKLSEKSPIIITFQNIEEVLKIGSGPSLSDFNYYFVILYTAKKNKKKIGFLIGNVKNLGDVLIGIWPFNEQLTEKSKENILESFDNLIKKPHEYSEIALITG